MGGVGLAGSGAGFGELLDGALGRTMEEGRATVLCQVHTGEDGDCCPLRTEIPSPVMWLLPWAAPRAGDLLTLGLAEPAAFSDRPSSFPA